MVNWRSRKQSRIDISEYLDSPGYTQLKDESTFKRVVTKEWGHGVEWNDGEITIDADSLYRLGKSRRALPSQSQNSMPGWNGMDFL
ncbi:DUF2442 domain-containing protein [Geomonas sp. RF6]|uniref:DUF2442 domain-containing protein n=1 Tax=Geomonas sp. RF6 TaxID=2897342 RepID=UPI001E383DCA|nr:DUF2442 domain-containing protein [Geomonas sp. RF6]UFS72771.1 DUF2442 domain-containing protein [Geomonas sp. RF6]